MGTKYSTQSATGYDASPPSDDGTAVASNEVKWSFIKTKLASPVKDLADNMNTALLTHIDESVLDKGVAYTTTAADHKRTINVTAAATQSLGDAATMAAGYIVTIKNSHTAAITVDLATGADTLDGTAAGSLSLPADEAVTVVVNSSADGYLIKSRGLDIDTRATAFAAAYPAQVTNYERSGNTQLLTMETVPSSDTVMAGGTGLASATWESWGPTGSGADNIWTAMDALPSTATAVHLMVDMQVRANSASETGISVYLAQGTITPATIANNTKAAGILITAATSDYVSISAPVIAPLDSNQVFQLAWLAANSNTTGENMAIWMRGFKTD